MARQTPETKAIIQEQVEELVFSHQLNNDFKLELAAARLHITKKVLKDKCNQFFESIQHDLTTDELHLYYRGCINKLLFIIHQTRCTPTEKTRAISELSKIIESYNNICRPQDNTDGDNDRCMLNGLLRQLYTTPEGLKIIEHVEAEINNN
jgi:hypothetical protein